MRRPLLRAVLPTCVALALAASEAAPQATWFVDRDAVAGANDGSGWGDAFLDLQSALALAAPGDVVRVAGGSYVPGVARGDSFVVPSGVGLFGGHAGVGWPDPDARDLVMHETVLSGDLLGDDLPGFGARGDNAFHVVVLSASQPLTVVLDGLTVRGGQADGAPALERMRGGDVFAETGAHVLLRDCRLLDGFAACNGGGLFAEQGVVELRRCEVSGNRVDNSAFAGSIDRAGGGGLYTLQATNTLFGCTFEDNACVMDVDPGTGIGAAGAGLEESIGTLVTHCRFARNRIGAVGYREARGAGFGALTTSSLGLVWDCVFEENVLDAPGGSLGDGGAGAFINGYNRVVACRFLGNSAPDAYGGGLVIVSEKTIPFTTVESCEFSGNTAAYAAGVFAPNSASAILPIEIAGCTIAHNEAFVSGGGLLSFGLVSLTNSIAWGNVDASGGGASAQVDGLSGSLPTVTWSDVQGWTSGGAGNLALDPRLVDALGPDLLAGTADDDLRLLPGSPCIDAGDSDAQPTDMADVDHDGDVAEATPVDATARLRAYDDPATPDTGHGSAPLVDMGAHESGDVFPDERWTPLGGALAGSAGLPDLVGSGVLCAFTDYRLRLTHARPLASAWLVIGASPIFAGFKGGTLVPAPDLVVAGLPTGPFGAVVLTLPWVDEDFPGVPLWWQFWIQDPAGPVGWAASNAVTSVTPSP